MSIDRTISEGSIGEKIGKYTKYQREKQGFSLNEYAKKIGVTTSFLLRLEKGTYKNVSLKIIEKLAQGFDMPITDFLLKCRIVSASETLPPIEYYLKEMYQFLNEAIEDVKLFVSVLKIKFKKQIQELEAKHKEYWKKTNS